MYSRPFLQPLQQKVHFTFDFGTLQFDKIVDNSCHANIDHIITWLILLKNQIHRSDLIFGMSLISFEKEIDQEKLFLHSMSNLAHRG
jgi:hypothetical protein